MNAIICEECETVAYCMEKGCIPKVKSVPPYKEFYDGKAVVYYTGTPVFAFWNNDLSQPVARLERVYDHPRLGDCRNVRTSRIQELLIDGTICTLNTVYRPAPTEEMGT